MVNKSCNVVDLIDDINQIIDKKNQQYGGNKLNMKKRVKSVKKNKKRGSKMLSKSNRRKQSHISTRNKTNKVNKLWWLRRRGGI